MSGADPELLERLKSVKPKLLPLIKSMDERIGNYVSRLHDALVSAVAGWSSGLLEGLGEQRSDGQPSFIIPETKEGDHLLRKIDPFRSPVAKVISALPDLGVIRSMKQALARLRPHLAEAARQEELTLERDTEYLRQRAETQRG